MSEPCKGCQDGCTCGCCEGTAALTPLETANRPGLDALQLRVGTHSTFLETMRARLSSQGLPALAGLTSREPADPALAMLDAWATVADVLTFYQERIANEGYLRTATERRSVRDLARLVGYELRPGVAASTWLAFTLEPGPEVVIPAGARAQSVPAPGELPQPFETSRALTARAAWNQMAVRRTRPQLPAEVEKVRELYLKGIATGLKLNDPLLIQTTAGVNARPGLYRVKEVHPDAAANRTRVTFEPWLVEAPATPSEGIVIFDEEAPDLADVVREIAERAADPERSGVALTSATAKRVLQLLQPLRAADGIPPDDLFSLVTEEILPALRQEHSQAIEGGFKKLEPWIGQLIADLEAAVQPPDDDDFEEPDPDDDDGEGTDAAPGGILGNRAVLDALGKEPSKPPADPLFLEQNPETSFDPQSDTAARLLLATRPELRKTLYTAWGNLPVAPQPTLQVWALRLRAAIFGHNAPLALIRNSDGVITGTREWTVGETTTAAGTVGSGGEQPKVAILDASYPQILPGGWIVLERPTAIDGSRLVITRVVEVVDRSRAAYGLSAKATHATLQDRWVRLSQTTSEVPDLFNVVRGTAVYAQSEALELAEAPVRQEVSGAALELAGLYDGLEAGRWLIVTGERTDLEAPSPERGAEPVPLSGVPGAELVMVAAVRQGIREETVPPGPFGSEGGRNDGGDDTPAFRPRPGERTHTTLLLAEPLAYRYRRDTVVVWGNVAPATHGETRSEVLGGGRASEPWQRFTLKQAPLTYVSARTPSGIESTLRVRVNDVLWHEAPSLFGLNPTDHVYTTRTGDDGHTEVVFGDGRRGARLPTGNSNVHALYRSGIGAGGNLDEGRITQLVTRPLSVKDVTNPLPATGGAGPESRDQAKRNAPLAVMALDRLVSVQDYADFARTFAGVGRAVAARLSDGRSQLVHVTIAGEDDIPIGPSSELLANLNAALRRFGDPQLRVQVAVRELALLMIAAGVRLLPDYLWEAVAPKIRAALFAALGFARRDLAEDALRSVAVRAIHSVPGVDYVDVDLFDRVTAAPAFALKSRIRARSARAEQGKVLPAQLVYLTPAVPDTVILKELPA